MSAAGPHPTVLGIAGSPRRHGNSERLLDACLARVAATGATVDLLAVADHTIAPCTGCGSCSSTGVCVIDDDMTAIYGRLDAADAIVVASPVYFATVPAVLKALYDRLQPYWARRYLLGIEPSRRRPGAALLVRAGGDPFGFSAALAPTKSVFAVLGIDCIADLAVEGPDAPSDIAERHDDLARAASVGDELVRHLRAFDGA